jgi:hypothetical protein
MRATLLALAIALSAIAGAPAQATPSSPDARSSAPRAGTEGRDVVPVRVSKTSAPGRLRVTNPNDRWVRFLWGTFRRAQPDGRKRVEAYQTVTIRVERRRIDWIALLDGYQVAGQGSVRDIDL